ncbi:hypothetical protein LTR65_010271 [Meristemomyces frigidus]
MNTAHAERAVELYKGLYNGAMAVDPNDADAPTRKQLSSKMTLIKGAEGILEQARADAKKYPAAAYDNAAMKADIEAIEAMEQAANDERDRADAAAAAAEALESQEQGGEDVDMDQRADTPPESQPQIPELVLSQVEDAAGEDDFPELPTPPLSRRNQ